MSRTLSLNGVIAPAAAIPAGSSAALYGRGVFTTISIREGLPFLWDKHWGRITLHARLLSVGLSERSERSVLAALSEAIAASGLNDCRARLTFFDSSDAPIWGSDRQGGTDMLIAVSERRPSPINPKPTSSARTVNSASPLAGVKSCNYIEHLMAYEEARDGGADEAVRLNERGHVTSACMANVFWETGGKLRTPSLSTGCLAGTTREFILENLECEEVEAGIDGIDQADRIFLTSAGIGVAAAAHFRGRPLDTSDHPILKLLRE